MHWRRRERRASGSEFRVRSSRLPDLLRGVRAGLPLDPARVCQARPGRGVWRTGGPERRPGGPSGSRSSAPTAVAERESPGRRREGGRGARKVPRVERPAARVRGSSPCWLRCGGGPGGRGTRREVRGAPAGPRVRARGYRLGSWGPRGGPGRPRHPFAVAEGHPGRGVLRPRSPPSGVCHA